MQLFYTKQKRDPELMHKIAQAGYKTEHPEKIGGYAGAFMLSCPDFYVTDTIANWLKDEPSLAEGLNSMISKFAHGDYGVISSGERIENAEARYVAFGFLGVIGRYSAESLGSIVLECFGYTGPNGYGEIGIIYNYGADRDRLRFLTECFNELGMDIDSLHQFQLEPRPW